MALFVLTGLALSPASGSAQPADDPAASVFELDLARLVFDQPFSANDPVWRIEARAGRALVAIPLTVGEVKQAIELSRSPVMVRGSRLVAFYLPKADDPTRNGEQGPSFNVLAAAKGEALDRLLFGDPNDAKGKDTEGTGEAPKPEAGDDAKDDEPPKGDAPAPGALGEKPKPGPAPESAPRVTRRATFHPDGTMSWGMERAISGGVLQAGSETNLYPFKIDPRKLAEKQPPRPERLQRQEGEDGRAFADRKRKQQLEEREKQKAFRELRDQVRVLPSEFREPAPKLIYAIVEYSDRGVLALQGPAPLPWELDKDTREALNQLAIAGGRADDEQAIARIQSLTRRVEQGQVMDQRAVAIAALRGNLVASVEEDDPGFKLVATLLASEDALARRVTQYAVARTASPTRASARLLEVGGKAAKGEEAKLLRFASMRTLFDLEAADPESAGFVASKVNELLADPQGPGPERVIDSLMQSLGNVSTAGVKADPAVYQAFVKAMDLSKVKEASLDDVIKTLIQHSRTNPYAAGLLDAKLLSAKDPAVIDRTLKLLVAAKPEADEKKETRSADEPGFDSSEQDAIKTIPLWSETHGMIQAIKSKDSARQKLAWQAVVRFHVSTDPFRRPGEDGGEGDKPVDPVALYDVVLTAAKGNPEVPASFTDFIVQQPMREIQAVVPQRLIDLVIDPKTGKALATAVAQRFLAGGRPCASVITQMVDGRQPKAARALYKALDKQAPLALGLIEEQGGRVLTWFVKEVEAGRLPTQSAWAAAAVAAGTGGEKALLDKAASVNDVVARAAASALVANAGGTEQDQLDFAGDIEAMSDRKLEPVEKAWAERKKKLYTRFLAKASGIYTLQVTLIDKKSLDGAEGALEEKPSDGSGGSDGADTPVDSDDAGAAKKPEQPKAVSLGLVQFDAKDDVVTLSVKALAISMSPDRLGIRINDVTSLKSFDNPMLEGLSVERLNGTPVDLLPQDDGSWAGRVDLPDERTLLVALVPQPE